jgi:hypothetical protein
VALHQPDPKLEFLMVGSVLDTMLGKLLDDVECFLHFLFVSRKLSESWKQQQLDRLDGNDEAVKQWVESRVAATNLAAWRCLFPQKISERSRNHTA